MSGGVAANVYRYGQARNVGGIGENAYLQGSCRAAETARTDAELVDFFQQFFLQLGYVRLFAHTADRAEKGFLAEEGCPLHRSADADAHDDGGQGLPPAWKMVSMTNSLIPFTPALGVSIFSPLLFSLPKPFGATVMWNSSPDTIS